MPRRRRCVSAWHCLAFDSSAMTFDAFLEAAWNDHGDHPQEVADRLAASLALVEAPEHIPPFARLVTHVFGEHLGQWRRGIDLLDAMHGLPAFDGGAATAGTLTRCAATLGYAGGDSSALEPLVTEDRVYALASAASVFAARNEFKRAIAAYTEALRLADSGLPSGHPPFGRSRWGAITLRPPLKRRRTGTAPKWTG